MEMLIFFAILALNTFISWWNCRVVGMAWKDVMIGGTWFEKALLWCGAIQSSIGFSMLFLLPLGFGGMWYLTTGTQPTLTPEQGHAMVEGIFSLWYVLIIFPALGSGLLITIHSVLVAIRTRRIGDILGAGYNVVAQAYNTYQFLQNFGGAWANVGELFGKLTSGKDNNAKLAGFAIGVVILSLVAGVAVTFALIRYYASKAPSVLADEVKKRGFTKKAA